MEKQSQPQSILTPVPSNPLTSVKQINKLLLIIVVLVFLLMTGGLVYLGYQNYRLRQQLDRIQQGTNLFLPFPTQTGDAPLPTQQVLNTGYLTDTGYRNEKVGFSIEFPKSWVLDEEEYIGSANGLTIGNKSLDIAISITYMKAGLDGQTGPTGMAGDLVKKGTFVIAGKTLERYHNIFTDEESIETIDAVLYSDPTKERGLEFILDNVQFTIGLRRYMDKDYRLGEPLTKDRIEKAEHVLATLKTLQ